MPMKDNTSANTTWSPTDALREKCLLITQRLQQQYHAVGTEQGHSRRLPAVDELMLTLLSQSTTDINSWRGYQALRERYTSWDAMADAPVAEIAALIHQCGLAQQKAPRMKAILQRLREERGAITLDFLTDLPPAEALAYLMSFHGVGRKTASCVLLFSLDMPAMPVDTHVLRVTRRLGLIPARGSVEQAHQMLESLLPEMLYLTFHLNVITHGRETCSARNPACERCIIADICPFYLSGQR